MTFREARYLALASMLVVLGGFVIGFTGNDGSLHHASHTALALGGALLIGWAVIVMWLILVKELR